MTLIAIACKGDTAEFVTDSMAYTKNLGTLGHTTKSQIIHHLDAAVLSAGDNAFGVEAKSTLLHRSLSAPTFDDLVDETPALLCDLDDQMRRDLGDTFLDKAPPTVFLVGWSPRRSKFDAYHFAAEDDYEPTRISGLHVMPSAFDERPSSLELRRLRAEFTDVPTADWERWQARPKRPVPRTLIEWGEMALQIREDRTFRDFAKTIVGGRLYYTRMEREHITTMMVFEFDDTGEELLELVSYTQHPEAQKRPCWCGSGKTHLECHLAEHYADGHLCDCGSGKPFGECCMVTGMATEEIKRQS